MQRGNNWISLTLLQLVKSHEIFLLSDIVSKIIADNIIADKESLALVFHISKTMKKLYISVLTISTSL